MSRTARDERLYQMYCRQPGTRINDIMTMIEAGYSDEAIAACFDRLNNQGAHTCIASDIAVYRKAHDGKLSKPIGTAFHWGDHKRRDAYIAALRSMGWMRKEIAALFGLGTKAINDILLKESRPR